MSAIGLWAAVAWCLLEKVGSHTRPNPVESYRLPCGCLVIDHNDGRPDDPFVLHLCELPDD